MSHVIAAKRACGDARTEEKPPPVIYGLVDPRDGRVRYVGKTVEPKKRLYMHIWQARCGCSDLYRDRWIRTLLTEGIEPELVTLETTTEDDWQAAERRWIATLDGLTNVSAGGDGVDAPRTAEWVQKIGAAHKGKVVSAETRERLRAARLTEMNDTCKRGHSLTGDNVRMVMGKNGRQYRQCRTCLKLSWTKRNQRVSEMRKAAGPEPRKPRQRPAFCKRGHPLSGDNLRTLLRKDGYVEHICRECVRIRNRKSDQRRRGQRS